MPFRTTHAVIAVGLFLGAAQAGAVTISFDELAAGTTLSNQYTAVGATFVPNAFSGAGGPNGTWGTNANMTIVDSTGGDVGALGVPSLVSGNVLRSFDGWLGENGDPSFAINFTVPVTSISVDFAGVDGPSASDTRLFAYNGLTQLGFVAGTVGPAGTVQFSLSFSAASITSVRVTPGSYNDWVGVDNVVFAPVPEPATYTMMGLGVAALLAFRRRARV